MIMAEDTETKTVEPVEEIEKEIVTEKKERESGFDKESWKPRTKLGEKIKSGEISDMESLWAHGYRIMEPQIVDILVPGLESEFLLIGQAKGKFGGGQRRIFRQTQKKTKEGNKPKFTTFVVVGNKNGYVGLGNGSARETVPAKEKAMRDAKLNIFKIRRGCGSWQCGCRTHHSIPFTVIGKCGSVRVKLMPAPKGSGLIANSEVAKMLKIAGIKDVWTKVYGKTSTRINVAKATEDALKRLLSTKTQSKYNESLGMVEGAIKSG